VAESSEQLVDEQKEGEVQQWCDRSQGVRAFNTFAPR